ERQTDGSLVRAGWQCRKQAHRAARGDFVDMVVQSRFVEVAYAVKGQPFSECVRRQGCKETYRAGRCDLVDHVVVGIRYIEVAGDVEGETSSFRPGWQRRKIAYRAGRCDLADIVVGSLHIEVAAAVNRQTGRK